MEEFINGRIYYKLATSIEPVEGTYFYKYGIHMYQAELELGDNLVLLKGINGVIGNWVVNGNNARSAYRTKSEIKMKIKEKMLQARKLINYISKESKQKINTFNNIGKNSIFYNIFGMMPDDDIMGISKKIIQSKEINEFGVYSIHTTDNIGISFRDYDIPISMNTAVILRNFENLYVDLKKIYLSL